MFIIQYWGKKFTKRLLYFAQWSSIKI